MAFGVDFFHSAQFSGESPNLFSVLRVLPVYRYVTFFEMYTKETMVETVLCWETSAQGPVVGGYT